MSDLDAIEAHVHEVAGYPALRICRLREGGLEIEIDDREWIDAAEANDFATWLSPLVQTFVEHDVIARKVGAPIATLRRVGTELHEIARILTRARRLYRSGRRWRFVGGPAPADAPRPKWGSHGRLL